MSPSKAKQPEVEARRTKIRELFAQGVSRGDIAQRFGISRGHVNAVVKASILSTVPDRRFAERARDPLIVTAPTVLMLLHPFKLEDKVEWQPHGHWRKKHGMVVEVVPEGRRPKKSMPGHGGKRRTESYLVREDETGQLFWPTVSLLRRRSN